MSETGIIYGVHNGFEDCYNRACDSCHDHLQDERHTLKCGVVKRGEMSTHTHIGPPSSSCRACVANRTLNDWTSEVLQEIWSKHHDSPGSGQYETVSARTGEAYDIRRPPEGGTMFQLVRRKDESGVSGVGAVLDGCVFADGTTVVRWCTQNAPASTVVYGIEEGITGWERFLDIHVQSHHNDVEINFTRGKAKWSWQQHPDPDEVRQKVCERVMKTLREYLNVLNDQEEEIYGIDRDTIEQAIYLAYETAPDSKSLQGLLSGTPFEIEEAAQFVEKAYNKARRWKGY